MVAIMGRRMKFTEYTDEERRQIRHVEKMEEEMERELRMDYSKMSDWVERFIAELEKPDCCSEAELRINWLMFRLMCGNYDASKDVYVKPEEITSRVPNNKDTMR